MPPMSAMSDRYGLPVDNCGSAFEGVIRSIERENVLIQFSWMACVISHCSWRPLRFVVQPSEKSMLLHELGAQPCKFGIADRSCFL
jgi:hypothetical protein